MDWQRMWDNISTQLTAFGLKALGALAVWIVGRYLISMGVRLVSAALTRQHVDPTLLRYVGNIVSVALNIVLVVAILGLLRCRDDLLRRADGRAWASRSARPGRACSPTSPPAHS